MPRRYERRTRGKTKFSALIYRLVTAVFIGLFLTVFLFWKYSESAPRLANPYLRWDIPSGEVSNLAKWDVIIVDMENQITNPEELKKIKQLNPRAILLAYISSQEIRNDAAHSGSKMRKKLMEGIRDEWYLAKDNGERYSYWAGTTMLNPSDTCPAVNGMKWNNYLANFVANDILSTGLWDGVFYDNAWGNLTWFTGKNVDLNRDGVIDADVDGHWNSGMQELFRDTIRRAGDRFIIVGNAMTREYRDDWNGAMFENLERHAWRDVIYAYLDQAKGSRRPRVIIINSNTENTGAKADYRKMRFGLTSTLLGDGYYSFDYGDKDHSQTWWYDEYDVELGDATAPAAAVDGSTPVREGVWRRDYTHGLALVNSTGKEQVVDLGGEYEKLIGRQDPTVNDGSITNRVTLGAKDGVIMLKTFQTIDKLAFGNGNFLRFFDAKGQRARNGFFAYDEAAAGGARIYRGDLDNKGDVERITATANRIEIFNSAGVHWFDDHPFGVSSKGNLNFAVGDLFGKGRAGVAVASSAGGAVNVYNYYGRAVKENYYPLGKKYNKGFTSAIGNLDGGVGEVILGTGKGVSGEVLVFDDGLKNLKKRFYPFEKKYTGGVKLAAGDVNGDGRDEIVAVANYGRYYLARVFDGKGKKMAEFKITASLPGGEYSVGAADVNFDGRAEIVIMTGS